MTVTNSLNESVELTAKWKEEVKVLGVLEPGQSLGFKVRDEAAIKFIASTRAGGSMVSETIYFTSGIGVIATIRINEIKVSHDFGT